MANRTSVDATNSFHTTTKNKTPTLSSSSSRASSSKLSLSLRLLHNASLRIRCSGGGFSNFCSKTHTARSRRRSRWRGKIPYITNSNTTPNTSTSISTSSRTIHEITCAPSMPTHPDLYHKLNKNGTSSDECSRSDSDSDSDSHSPRYFSSNSSSSSSSKFTRPAISLLNAVAQETHIASVALVAVLLILSTCSLCTASPCDTQSWWDPVKDKCIPCTVCEGDLIPLRPCQLHRDTICGSIYDLKIDWFVLAKTEPNWKERRKADDVDYNLDQQLTHEELLQLHEDGMPLDWQTVALFMAVLACLLFFIIAACILVHHMRQWRRMERRLDQDVEELSTKLMAKLAEVQSLEGGTFYIGNADALGVVPTAAFQPQRVQLPEKPTKESDRRIQIPSQHGNVYIEGHGSKG